MLDRSFSRVVGCRFSGLWPKSCFSKFANKILAVVTGPILGTMQRSGCRV